MNDVRNVRLYTPIWVSSITCISTSHTIRNGNLMQSGILDISLWSNQFSLFFGWDSAFFPFSFCLNRQLTSAIWITKSKVTRAWNSTSIHMGSFHQPYFALVKHFYIRGSSIWSSLMRIRMVLHAQPAAIKRRDFISDYVIEKHFILKHSFFSSFDFT